MPKRHQLLADMQGEDRHAALLVAQVGAMPTEIQLIIQTARYEEAIKGLHPIRSYIIRVVGAIEHRISNLGMTTTELAWVDDHPLLWQYTQAPAALFFRGQPDDAHALALELAQAHASTFRGWRHFPEYFSLDKPLYELLVSGGGLLGQMPQALAEACAPILERHGLETKVLFGRSHTDQAQGPLKHQKLQTLLIGESYFISYTFSVEEMVARPGSG
ncbi:MAG: hypothetical protein NZ750_02115 [Anaerolineae bacterium]|nr:hypothetical protein [Anaerolineae bacterium]MDW8173526.1 hypothetical protein [Anaerolineae bacterium]